MSLPGLKSSNRHPWQMFAPSPNTTRYALVMTGGGSYKEYMKKDGEGMVKALKKNGFDEGNINYLKAEDVNTPLKFMKNWGEAWKHLIKNASPGDDVFIYITAHGVSKLAGPAGFQLGTSQLEARVLADWIKDLAAGCRVTAVIQSCYSGRFIEELKKVDKVEAVYTSASADELSYFDIDPEKWKYTEHDFKVKDPNPNDEGSEYSSGFIEDMNEYAGKPEAKTFKDLLALSHKSAKDKHVVFLAGMSHPNEYIPAPTPTRRPGELQKGDWYVLECEVRGCSCPEGGRHWCWRDPYNVSPRVPHRYTTEAALQKLIEDVNDCCYCQWGHFCNHVRTVHVFPNFGSADSFFHKDYDSPDRDKDRVEIPVQEVWTNKKHPTTPPKNYVYHE